MTGLAWIAESGTVRCRSRITNTHAVGVAPRATIDWAVELLPELARAWLLPVAAETYDGYLNDINGGHVTEQSVRPRSTRARRGRSSWARPAAAPA